LHEFVIPLVVVISQLDPTDVIQSTDAVNPWDPHMQGMFLEKLSFLESIVGKQQEMPSNI
jgi:hypothetical protein